MTTTSFPAGLASTIRPANGRSPIDTPTTPWHELSTIDALPITKQLPPNTSKLEKAIPHPYIPRAVAAVSIEHPEGSPERKGERNLTVLQQHVEFWDRGGKGHVTVPDVYAGFRAIGCNIVLSIGAVFAISPAFALLTADGWIPDPLLRINMHNLHRSKHGSTSRTYDKEGRFQPNKFEEIFTKFDADGKGGLSFQEIVQMYKSRRDAMDLFGWFAAFLEWFLLYVLVADVEKDILYKEDIRRMYDGTLFHKIADQRKAGQGEYVNRGVSFTTGLRIITQWLFRTLRYEVYITFPASKKVL